MPKYRFTIEFESDDDESAIDEAVGFDIRHCDPESKVTHMWMDDEHGARLFPCRRKVEG